MLAQMAQRNEKYTFFPHPKDRLRQNWVSKYEVGCFLRKRGKEYETWLWVWNNIEAIYFFWEDKVILKSFLVQ